MKINHNISSLNTLNQLAKTDNAISKSLSKLSSGLRIVSADDDASGLAISEGMRAQISGLESAKMNANEGLSALTIAESGMGQQESILQRMASLAVRASNEVTLTDSNRALMQSEINQLGSEYTRLNSALTFNGKQLLDGSFNGSLQVGELNAAADRITINIAASTFDPTAVDLTSVTTAQQAIDTINNGISGLSSARGTIGAVMNRLTTTVDTLGVQITNVTAAESNIRDVDMAAEMSNYTKLQVLSQAGTAMLSQANSQTQTVLSLLK